MRHVDQPGVFGNGSGKFYENLICSKITNYHNIVLLH